MKFALLQINPTVGALKENRLLIANKANEAFRQGADIICLSLIHISEPTRQAEIS
mgnify:CR=1 FL=1